MPSEKISKFNQYTRMEKMLYIIYTDLNCLVKKMDGCATDPGKSSTTKIGEHIICGCSMSTLWGCDHIKIKHTLWFAEKIAWKGSVDL